jgi:hypothetical protein
MDSHGGRFLKNVLIFEKKGGCWPPAQNTPWGLRLTPRSTVPVVATKFSRSSTVLEYMYGTRVQYIPPAGGSERVACAVRARWMPSIPAVLKVTFSIRIWCAKLGSRGSALKRFRIEMSRYTTPNWGVLDAWRWGLHSAGEIFSENLALFEKSKFLPVLGRFCMRALWRWFDWKMQIFCPRSQFLAGSSQAAAIFSKSVGDWALIMGFLDSWLHAASAGYRVGEV